MQKKCPQRKQIRLKEYDYSTPGYYFITICTQNRKEILGKIINAGADSISARKRKNKCRGGQSRPPLQKIIQGFKSITTMECFKYKYKKIWQRNYYEHIIRNEKEYYKIIEYINNNQLNWEQDKYFKA